MIEVTKEVVTLEWNFKTQKVKTTYSRLKSQDYIYILKSQDQDYDVFLGSFIHPSAKYLLGLYSPSATHHTSATWEFNINILCFTLHINQLSHVTISLSLLLHPYSNHPKSRGLYSNPLRCGSYGMKVFRMLWSIITQVPSNPFNSYLVHTISNASLHDEMNTRYILHDSVPHSVKFIGSRVIPSYMARASSFQNGWPCISFALCRGYWKQNTRLGMHFFPLLSFCTSLYYCTHSKFIECLHNVRYGAIYELTTCWMDSLRAYSEELANLILHSIFINIDNATYIVLQSAFTTSYMPTIMLHTILFHTIYWCLIHEPYRIRCLKLSPPTISMVGWLLATLGPRYTYCFLEPCAESSCGSLQSVVSLLSYLLTWDLDLQLDTRLEKNPKRGFVCGVSEGY